MAQTWVVLLHGDEKAWETADEATQAAAYADHDAFSTACAERGHTIVGGHELASSRRAVVVRNDAEGLVVTDGPYTETVEQLGGYYVVETDDVQDLARLVETVLWPGDVAEIRPVA
ncbi:YciI family protein [Cellulomonas fimi]|uniref:YciI family protein n=1 Tax=Cellulomonas fimi TaxID=1708 RepID=UPI00234C4B90|nr:YciI family protein [Cellulomonas fimi]MDC7123297.1 YciI family protein [Cellulomonas fimi]